MEKPKKLKYLAISAHPDDMEVAMGGCLWKLARAGHDVRIVSLTNGDAGHHQMRPPEVASNIRQADTFRSLLDKRHLKRADIIQHAECFELSEYGRRPEPREWEEILPA